jgi:hypothetical protein
LFTFNIIKIIKNFFWKIKKKKKKKKKKKNSSYFLKVI